jgi:hypothetical protein
MLDGTCGKTEVEMTFKIADIANEAQLVEIRAFIEKTESARRS